MSLEVGAIVEGEVTGITNFGAFVQLPEGKVGLIHISEVSNVYVKDVHDFLKEHDKVKVKVLSVYAASLIDTMEVMDQMIYEIYRKMQDYFKASVKAVLETGRDYVDFDDFDEESELMFAYAVLKGCRMKALHTEKYEGIVLGVCDKVMAGEIFTDDDTDKNVVSKAALVYSETVRNREYQDYGRGKGGALWS